MKKKNKISIKTAIIAGVVLFCLIVPTTASAVLGIETLLKNTAIDLLVRLVDFIFNLLGFLVRAGAAFFEGMLNIGFKSHLDIVKAGWTVTRDFSNMFFILFLVIIAFATILRFEQYGIRQLLPKVILIALLINFSFVIASVIIDFSNIAANFFIDGIENRLGGKEKIASTFTDSLNLTSVYFGTDCEKEHEEQLKICNQMIEGHRKMACKTLADMDFEKCMKALGLPTKPPSDWGTVLSLLISVTVGSLVLLIAAFALFAGGILLLIRVVAIWFLVMIVPPVFICYIMPSLRKNWQTWWSNFLKWCFFAPAYAFFIWLAIEVSVANKNKQLAAGVESAFTQFVDAGPLANPFTSDPGQQLISYAFIIALLIGGLIAAQKLSIYGASTAMNIVNKAKQGTVNWAKRTSMRPVKAAGKAVGAGALLAGGKLFGGKLGRRMEAKGFQLRQKAAEEKQHKAFQGLLKTMSDEDVKKEMHTKGIRGFLATQEAKRRGVLREAKREDVGRAMETMRAHGAAEEARSLEELRPDAVKDGEKRGEAIERAIKEGTHKKWSEKVFESPEGAKIMGELQRQLGSTELTRVFKGWAKDIQTEAEKALKEGFSENFDEGTNVGKDNMGRRRTYAAVTGELDNAFGGYQQNKQLKDKLGDYVGGWGNEDFKALNNPRAREARKIVIEFMKPSQVDGAAAHLSGSVKEEMLVLAEQYNKPVFEQMQKSLGWGGKPPTTGPTPTAGPSRIVDLKTSEEEFRKAREEAKKRGEKFG